MQRRALRMGFSGMQAFVARQFRAELNCHAAENYFQALQNRGQVRHSFLFLRYLTFRKFLRVRPKPSNRHAEVAADSSHHITRDIGSTALNSAEIVGTVAK